MKKGLSIVKALVYFLMIMLFTFFSLNFFVPRPARYSDKNVKTQSLTFTAIGDSITHGIGDTNQNQGFVGALKDRIEQEKGIKVTAYNFGYTGKTSEEIKSRIYNNSKLRKAVAQSSFITFNMGGNDMIYTIQKNFFNLDKKQFEPKKKSYQANLLTSLREIRKINPQAKIIVLGIYNPFHLFFSQIKDLNDLFIEWNEITLNTAKKVSNTYYQDINHLLNGPQAKSEVEGKVVNKYLSEDDDVHPNGLGYSLIANTLYNFLEKNKIIR